jgi:DNA-binding HxlR family transcriptional regulator
MVSKFSQYDVLDPKCLARQVLALISDKWTIAIIYALAGGTRRFGELQRRINGVSPKMLTQTIRKLEIDGLVERKVYPSVPPKVEYALTPLGETLVEPILNLCRWAEDHLDAVLQARSENTESERNSA